MIWKMEEDLHGDWKISTPNSVSKGYIYKIEEDWITSRIARERVPKHILDRFINQLERGYDKQTTTTNQGT